MRSYDQIAAATVLLSDRYIEAVNTKENRDLMFKIAGDLLLMVTVLHWVLNDASIFDDSFDRVLTSEDYLHAGEVEP